MKKIALMSGLFSILFVLSLGLMPSVLSANGSATTDATGTPTATAPSISFQIPNPLGSNTTTLNGFLANILDAVVLLLTPVITLMLLYSGFLFISAQGNAEELTKAKTTLMYTLIGAAVILGAKGLAEVLKNTVTCLTSSGTC